MSKKYLTFLFLLVTAFSQFAFGMKKTEEKEVPVEEIKLKNKMFSTKEIDVFIPKNSLLLSFSKKLDGLGVPHYLCSSDTHLLEKVYKRIFYKSSKFDDGTPCKDGYTIKSNQLDIIQRTEKIPEVNEIIRRLYANDRKIKLIVSNVFLDQLIRILTTQIDQSDTIPSAPELTSKGIGFNLHELVINGRHSDHFAYDPSVTSKFLPTCIADPINKWAEKRACPTFNHLRELLLSCKSLKKFTYKHTVNCPDDLKKTDTKNKLKNNKFFQAYVRLVKDLQDNGVDAKILLIFPTHKSTTSNNSEEWETEYEEPDVTNFFLSYLTWAQEIPTEG